MSYTVNIQPSGHSFHVDEGEKVLDAALRQGISMPYGCRNGACGSCKGKLLTGSVNYPDGLPGGISEAEQAEGDALFCQCHAQSDLEIQVRESEETGDIPIRTLPCRVDRIDHLSHDVIRMYLKLPETERLQFLAGQYIEILLKDGERRAFSLANAPHDDAFLELQIRHVEGGQFTDYVFSKMKDKTLLRFEGPHGSFYLRENSDNPIIMVAGGTGFAPVKGMVEHAISEGITRDIHIYWGVRAYRDLYLPDLPASWAEKYPNITFTPVLSEPMDEDNWQGRTGFVHETVMEDYTDLSGFDIYAGGPPVMVKSIYEAFIDKGMSQDNFFSDAFEYAHASKDK